MRSSARRPVRARSRTLREDHPPLRVFRAAAQAPRRPPRAYRRWPAVVPIVAALATLASAHAEAPPRAAAPVEARPPPELACLARYYGVTARLDADGAWQALLPDGARIPYRDHRTKSFDEQLAAPDVHDAFAQRYVTGSIVPVTTPDFDPGRVRLDPVFRATYGRSRAAVEAALVPVAFAGATLRVHRRAAPAFARVAARLDRAVAADPSLGRFLQHLSGTFVWRPIAGTDRPSAHSYGVSVDLDARLSHYWRWQRPPAPLRWANRIPQAIVDAFEAEGFIWGGRWYHYDTMHFEYRPELLDPACFSH